MNSIKNFPPKTEAFDPTHKTYGTEKASLKGKTVNQSPVPVVTGVIDLSRQLIASQ